MSDSDIHGDTRNRRRFLKGLGALSIVGLAGCGGDGDDDTDTPTDTDDGMTPTPTDTTTEPETTTEPGTTEPVTTTEPEGGTIPQDDPATLLSFDETPIVDSGSSTTVSGTVTNPYLFDLVSGEVTIQPPSDDWGVSPMSGTTIDELTSQSTQTAEWEISAPESASGEVALTVEVTYSSATDEAETSFEQPIVVVTPPEVSSESVPLDDLGATFRHAMVPQTGGGAADEVAFSLPEDGFELRDGSQNPVDDYGGTDDKSADVHLGYDEDNFYIRVVETDDVNTTVPGSGMWQGDCVQWATAADGRATYGPDYGMRHAEDGSEVVQYPAGNAEAGAGAIDLETSREGTTTTYDATVPWNAMYSDAPSAGDSIPFDLLIHDNDGESEDDWRGAISWSEYSIYTPKQPNKEGTVTLDTDDGALPWEARLTGTPDASQGERATFTVTVANYADTDQEITVSFTDSDVEETITVSANGAMEVAIEKTFLGGSNVGITVSNGESSETL